MRASVDANAAVFFLKLSTGKLRCGFYCETATMEMYFVAEISADASTKHDRRSFVQTQTSSRSQRYTPKMQITDFLDLIFHSALEHMVVRQSCWSARTEILESIITSKCS